MSFPSRQDIRQVLVWMTSDGVASWPLVVWVTAINVYASITAPRPSGSTELELVVASASSSVLMFAVLLPCWRFGLRRLSGTPRIIATLVSYVLAGIVRGLIFEAILVAISDQGLVMADLEFRVTGNATRMLVALALGTCVVTMSRQQHARISALRARQAEVESALALTEEGAIADRNAAIAQVTRELDAALRDMRDRDSTIVIKSTQKLATEVVRPLSHQMANEVPKLAVDRVSPASQRISWQRFWRRLPTGKYIKPGWSALAMFIFGLGPTLLPAGVFWTVLGSLVIYVTWYLCLLVVQRIAASPETVPSSLLRFAINTVLIVVSAAPPALIGTVIVREAPYNSALALSFAIQAPVIVWFVAVAFAMRAQGEESAREIAACDDELTRLLARARLVAWHQHGQLARALHGPVQSELMAAIYAMKSGPSDEGAQDGAASLVSRLRQRLPSVLAQEVATRELPVAVNDAAQLWRGTCAVEFIPDETALALLEVDPAASDLAVSIVQEAISNAVRHGRASDVVVTVHSVETNDVELVVADNGIPAPGASATPGMGTAQLHECTLEWDGSRDPHGYTLKAVLPIATSVRTAH